MTRPLRLLFDCRGLGFGPSAARTTLLGVLPHLQCRGEVELAILHDEDIEGVLGATVPCFRGATWFRRRLPADAKSWKPAAIARFGKAGLVTLAVGDAGRGGLGVSPDSLSIRPRTRGIAAVFVPTAVAAEHLKRLAPSLDGRVHVVPMGVAPLRDDGGDVPVPRGLRPGYLLVVGRLDDRKSAGTALTLRADLAARRINVPLIVAGQGPLLLEESLAWLRAEFPDQDMGEILRDVTQDELGPLFRHAGLVLVPTAGPTSGLVPLEALAFGTPVLLRDTPYHRELFGGVANLVSMEDPRMVTSYVLAFLEGRVDLLELRRKSRLLTEERTWSRTADAWVQILCP